MKLTRLSVVSLFALSLAACQTMSVNEARLPNGQSVAVVQTSGNGLTPSTTTVFAKHGRHYVVVNGGVGQPILPAVFNGAVAGAAIGAGIGFARPAVTNVSQSSSNVARSRAKSCSGLLTAC